MNVEEIKKIKMPDGPGVYFFYGHSNPWQRSLTKLKRQEKSPNIKEEIFYIGKATSLRNRVRSYFRNDIIETRGQFIFDMINQATKVKWQETDSVLEALILEAYLIKKHQPKYNTREKDDKSFNYVCVTEEKIPKVMIIREREIFFQQFANSSRFTPKGRKNELLHFSSVSEGNHLYERKRIDDKENYATQNLQIISKKFKKFFGPFPNGAQLKEAMKIVRRLFPYLDEQSSKKNNFEFYKQLGLVPEINVAPKGTFEKVLGRGKREPVPDHFQKHFSTALNIYKKNIKNLILFFEGKKKRIISNLKKEMIEYAKKKEFEKAGEIKKKIFALEHINDIALIKEENITQQNFGRSFLEEERSDGKGKSSQNFRIDPVVDFGDAHSKRASHFTKIHYRVEAYDIAHMSGKNMVGVMTVIENGEINKKEYRKFIIKTKNKADDTGALQEILERRFNHKEWRSSDLIVLDGGVAQINVAKRVLHKIKRTPPNINIVSVVKNEKHKPKAIMGNEKIIRQYRKEILLANNEAHRFAITFHKNRRNKNFIS